jgi:hypothetical protein
MIGMGVRYPNGTYTAPVLFDKFNYSAAFLPIAAGRVYQNSIPRMVGQNITVDQIRITNCSE